MHARQPNGHQQVSLAQPLLVVITWALSCSLLPRVFLAFCAQHSSNKMTTVETEFEEDSFEDDFEPEEEMEQYK